MSFRRVISVNRTTLILLIILAVTTIALIVLYFLGKRIQKRQDEQQAQIEANKQTFNMLVIDKKKLKFKEAGLPQSVVDSTPKWLRRSKVPVVRAKIGPQVMNLIADEKIFDQIPVKKEVRASISGIYITEVRQKNGAPLPAADNGKKKGKFKQFVDRLQERAGAKPVK